MGPLSQEIVGNTVGAELALQLSSVELLKEFLPSCLVFSGTCGEKEVLEISVFLANSAEVVG